MAKVTVFDAEDLKEMELGITSLKKIKTILSEKDLSPKALIAGGLLIDSMIDMSKMLIDVATKTSSILEKYPELEDVLDSVEGFNV